jgi:hypothetical protein
MPIKIQNSISKLKNEEAIIKKETGNYPFARYGWLEAELLRLVFTPQENKYSVRLET